MSLFLRPGDLLCDAMGLPKDSDHRQILRIFLNTLIWGALFVTVAVRVFV